MECNFTVVYGRHSTLRSAIDKLKLWRQMAEELNKLGPARNGEGWRNCFQDMKGNVNKKLAKHRRHHFQTGGGGPSTVKFSELDKKLIALCNINNVDGNQQQRELERTAPTPMFQDIQPSTSNHHSPSHHIHSSLTNSSPIQQSHIDRNIK